MHRRWISERMLVLHMTGIRQIILPGPLLIHPPAPEQGGYARICDQQAEESVPQSAKEVLI